MTKIILILFLSFNSYAVSLKIDTIEIDPLITGKFKVSNTNQLSDGYAELDCQSFFQKLDFFNAKGELITENYITVQECTEINDNINKCLKTSKIKCLDSDYLFETSCYCK